MGVVWSDLSDLFLIQMLLNSHWCTLTIVKNTDKTKHTDQISHVKKTKKTGNSGRNECVYVELYNS